MSSISPVSTAGYDLRYDANRPGDLALAKSEARDDSDTASISDMGRALSSQVAAMRDEAARHMDAAARYQAALEFGQDFASYMNGNINLVSETGHKHNSTELEIASNRQTQAFTTVSAQGTVIGISSLAPEEGHIRDEVPEVLTAQITRKDGLQLNIALEEDVRINDLEGGGLSIYYASSGITRTFDAKGRETVTQGEKNALGTGADDIIINRHSTHVDAGNGDDVIINLADGAELLGGDGNDKIFLPGAQSKGVTIDGGAGDDAIVGQRLDNASVIMDEGKDSLTATHITGATITSSGDDFIKTGQMIKSSLVSRNGVMNTDIAAIYESAVNIDRVGKDFSIERIRGSNLKFGDGDISVSSEWLADSEMTFGKGNVKLNISGIDGSTITHAHGSTSIDAGGIDNSTLNLAGGGNTLNARGFSHSELNLGSGGNTINAGFINDINLDVGSGGNTLNVNSIDNSSLNIGSGGNVIHARGIDNSTLNLGSGGNTLFTEGGIYDSRLDLGDGGNTLIADGGINDSLLNLGSNGNTVNASGINQSTLNMGSNGNAITTGLISRSTFLFGETGDAVEASGPHETNAVNQPNKIATSFLVETAILSKRGDINIATDWNIGSNVKTDHGKATISIDSSMNSKIVTGNGDDEVAVRSLDASYLETGDGNDRIHVNNASSSYIDAGKGDDTIWIENATNSTVKAGSGNNVLLTQAAEALAQPFAANAQADLDNKLMEALFGGEGASQHKPAAAGSPFDTEQPGTNGDTAGSMPYNASAGAHAQTDTQLTGQEFARRMMQFAAHAYAQRQ